VNVKARITLLLVLGLVTAASARANGEYRTVEVESLKVTIDFEWGQRTAPGYVPVRFDIANLGDARVIDIVGQGTRFFRARTAWQSGLSIRQPVRLARGDRVRLTIPVPVFGDNESIRFEIYEAGRVLERFNYNSFQSRNAPDDAAVLVVVDPASAFAKIASTWPRTAALTSSSFFVASGMVMSSGMSSSPGGAVTTSPARAAAPVARPALPLLDFLLEPARLPANWLGYTSLRAVVVGPTEWSQLNDAQKSAILSWTACGGDLVLVDGDFATVFPSAARSAATAKATTRAYFFGRIHRPTLPAITEAGLPGTLSAATAVQDSNFALPANRTSDWGVIAERGFRLPIPGVGAVPARSYLSILMLFSLLIGPANYWLLWRARRQVLLVLTTPLISAIFIVLLAGYVLAGEGLGVRGRAATVTMLDQVRKQAVTRASISLYAAGMTPAGGLRLPRDVAIFPIGPEGTGSREQLSLDLSESQRFGSGVIQARSPTNLEELVFRPARERLAFSPEAGGLAVVNGLGVPVAALIYRTGLTLHTLSGPLPAGGKAILKTGAGGAVVVPPGLPLSARLEHLFQHVPDGAYLAVLERSPFWEPGVPSVDERGSFHLVIGWPEGQPW
jgi:hypothetical protein